MHCFPRLQNNSVAFFFFQCLSAKQVREKELSAAVAITPLSHLMKGLVMSLRCRDWQQLNSKYTSNNKSLFYSLKSKGLQQPGIIVLIFIKLCFGFT